MYNYNSNRNVLGSVFRNNIYIHIYIYIQGVPKKKDTILIVIKFFRFRDTNFYFKEVLNILFDVLLRPFRDAHRIKGCNKYVSLFLIVRRKMAYLGVPNKNI